jgi:predicted RND superfamily exporter protein
MDSLFSPIYRSLIFVVFLVGSVWVVVGAMRALESNSNDVADWLPANLEETRRLREYGKEFGSDEFIMVSWPGCTLDDPKLTELTAELRKVAPGDAAVFQRVINGAEAIGQLQDEPLELTKEEALTRLMGLLVGPDRQTTCLVAQPNDYTAEGRRLAVERIHAAAESVAGLSSEQLRVAGTSVDNVAIDQASQKNLMLLGMLSFAACFILMTIGLRSLPLAVMASTVAWFNHQLTFAIVYYTGWHMDSVLLMAPSLVFVLSVSSAVHLTNYYSEAVREHGLPGAAWRAISYGWSPCLLASLTTSLGLISLTASYLVPIQKFGIYAACALLLGTVFLFLLLPALWDQFPLQRWARRQDQSAKSPKRRQHGWQRLLILTTHHHALISVVALVGLVACYWGVMRSQPSVALHDMFSADARILRDYRWIEEKIGPLVPVEVVVKLPLAEKNPESYTTPMIDRLLVVQKIQDRVRQIEGVGAVASVTTFGPMLPDADLSGFNLRDRARRRAIEMYLANHLDRFVELDYFRVVDNEGWWRISANVPASGQVDYQRVLRDLEQQVEEVLVDVREDFPGARALYCGGLPLIQKAQEQLLIDLINSFMMAFGLITLAMISMLLAFSWREFQAACSMSEVVVIGLRNAAAGVVSMIPNVLPCAVVFGVMGWLGIKIEVGTVMTATAAMGIAVDDTLHFITWFRRGAAKGWSRRDAIQYAFQHCAAAMIQTSLICGLGLLVFVGSEFGPIKRFAWMMFFMLTSALLADLLVLPALLYGPLGRLFTPSQHRADTPLRASIPAQEIDDTNRSA